MATMKVETSTPAKLAFNGTHQSRVLPSNEATLAALPVREQYQQRALRDLNLEVRSVDFGQHALTST
eukprot:6678402-Karenia_brevis.AAC.1